MGVERKVTPSKQKRYNFSEVQKLNMKSLYEDVGLSWEDIRKVFGCSRRTIEYHLRLMGVAIRPRGMSTRIQALKVTGPNNYYWKGGRSKDKNGYVVVTEYDHPIRGKSHMLEHRLVVENHLLDTDPNHPALENGMLSRKWVVHHKNGIKSDNRIENLEPLTRDRHHSWMHYRDEMKALKERVQSLEQQLDSLRIPHFAI